MQRNPVKTVPACWGNIYSDVAQLYTQNDDVRKKRMYLYIRHFIEQLVSSQLQYLRRFQGEQLLSEYVSRWKTSLKFAQFMKRVLHHLHRFWIWDHANTLKDDPVRPLDNLLMFYWREYLLTYMPSFVDVALSLVDDDRRGRQVRRDLIAGLVENLLTISRADEMLQPNSSGPKSPWRPHAHAKLHLYHQLFEEPFIASTTAFYRQEGRVRVNPSDVRAFMRDISERLREEDERAAALLHSTSLPAVRRAAEEQLIGSHCEYLQDSAKAMIESGNESDLRLVYNLLSRVDGGLTPVRNFFVSFVRTEGNSVAVDHVSSLNGNADIRQSLCLIDRLICLYLKHAGLVRRCLDSSNDFKMAIYDAFRGFVNRTIGPISLPVLLAHFLDHVIRSKKPPVQFAKAMREVEALATKSAAEDTGRDWLTEVAPSDDSRDAAVDANDKVDGREEVLPQTTSMSEMRVVSSTPQQASGPNNSSNTTGAMSSSEIANVDSASATAQPENNISFLTSQERTHNASNSTPSEPANLRSTNSQQPQDTDAPAAGTTNSPKADPSTPASPQSTERVVDQKEFSDEELKSDCLSEIVRFFMFLEDKETFFETHRLLFSKRLLSSHDEDLENQFIVELEEQMGTMYTHRLRGMLRDILSSNTLRKDFSAFLEHCRATDEDLATAGLGNLGVEELGATTIERDRPRRSNVAFSPPVRDRHPRRLPLTAPLVIHLMSPPVPPPHPPPSEDEGAVNELVPLPASEPNADNTPRRASPCVMPVEQARSTSPTMPSARISSPEDREAARSARAIDFNAHVLNTLHWPSVNTGKLIIPPVVKSCEKLFESFYMFERESRKLTWVHGMATANIRAHFGGAEPGRFGARRTYTFVASAMQMSVLLALNEQKEIGMEDLAQNLGVGVDEVRKAVRPLVVGKRSRVVQIVGGRGAAAVEDLDDEEGEGDKTGRTRTEDRCENNENNSIEKRGRARDDGREDEPARKRRTVCTGERLKVNEAFSSATHRVVIPTVVARVERTEGGAAKRNAVVDKNTLIDAAVVRLMKERKEMTYVELCTEVIARLSTQLVPDLRTIKPRLERLIDMEYLMRDEVDVKLYRYCA